jgi:MoaA/NifB/PqqE/SkfB family radical SAM enzyme
VTKTAIGIGKKDIKSGIPICYWNCPIAKAVQRKLKDGCDIWVLVNMIEISDGEEVWAVDLPPEAKNFISDFDDDKPVEPFQLRLDIPENLLKQE